MTAENNPVLNISIFLAFVLVTLYCVYLNTDVRTAVDPLLADLSGLG